MHRRRQLLYSLQQRQKTQQKETEARVLSPHQGTQVFPHSPNQHPSLRGQGQQIVALPSLVPDSPLHNYTIQSQIPTRISEVTDWELTTGAVGVQRGGQEWCSLSRRTDASPKNCISPPTTGEGGQLGFQIFIPEGV